MQSEKKNDRKNIWSQVERALEDRKHTINSDFNIWNLADYQYNMINYRPRKKDSAELAEIDGKNGVRSYMLRNPDNDTYLVLEEKDLYLWNLMDGRKSVKDLYIVIFCILSA